MIETKVSLGFSFWFGLVIRYEVSLANFKTSEGSVCAAGAHFPWPEPCPCAWCSRLSPCSWYHLPLPAFHPLSSWSIPRAWPGERWRSRLGRVGGRKGAYGGLAGPGGHPDDPWLDGLSFRFPFLCPHMFLAANRFRNESDLALNSFLAIYLL